MSIEFAQASQVNAAYAANPEVAPTTGWQQLLVNPSGTQNFHPEFVDVVANPQDPSMVKQLGEHVGENAAPTLVLDWSKLVAQTFVHGLLRSAPRAPWAQMPLRPTAVVDGGAGVDSFTVSGAAVLPLGTIIATSGFVNPQNNGVFTLVAGSGATALNVRTGLLAAETVTPTGSAMVEIVGFQFTAADLSINAAGHLASVSQALTVFQLQPGHRVYFRASADVGSFPTGTLAAGLHYATVAIAPTTNLITLKDRSFGIAAISGAGKTIRLYFGVEVRNVPFGHTDYIREPAYWLELTDPSVGLAGVSTFSYAESAVLNGLSLGLSTDTKIEATLSFLARKINEYNEPAARLAGASAAFSPNGASLFHTQCESMLVFRVVTVDTGVELVGQVSTATFSINHNASMIKAIGDCGASGAVFGDIDPMLSGMSVFFSDADQARAIRTSRIVRAEMLMKNAQGAIAIDLPTGRLTGGSKTYGENSPVMIDLNFQPHGDPTNSNVVCVINVLGYIPTADPTASQI